MCLYNFLHFCKYYDLIKLIQNSTAYSSYSLEEESVSHSTSRKVSNNTWESH